MPTRPQTIRRSRPTTGIGVGTSDFVDEDAVTQHDPGSGRNAPPTTAPPTTAPIAVVPVYPSERLVGLELEYDAGGTQIRLPSRTPRGWSQKTDGSLRNGVEMVLEPPLSLPVATSLIREFCRAFNEARMNTCKSGGFHVHVQAPDYTNEDSYKLVKLYSHFQRVINRLLARSRHNNHFCPPYPPNVTLRDVVSMFNLNSPAATRASAKGSRSYSVINLAMMRTSDPDQRTVEFRQGSTTKRFECVVGWTALCLALVDVVKEPAIYETAMRSPGDMPDFLNMVEAQERLIGGSGLRSWVIWRDHYMNAEPTPAQVSSAVGLIGSQPHGIFYVSRALNENLAMTSRILELAVHQGLLAKHGVKYQARFSAWADTDLAALRAAAEAREAGRAVPTAEPVGEGEDEGEDETNPEEEQ